MVLITETPSINTEYESIFKDCDNCWLEIAKYFIAIADTIEGKIEYLLEIYPWEIRGKTPPPKHLDNPRGFKPYDPRHQKII